MAITASMVKELRERTGAGMMDCKNILVEVDGNMDEAIDKLREKGLAKALKKSGRVASEGLVRVRISPDGSDAGIVEVNSETDFVAKNEDFKTFVDNVSCMATSSGATTLDDFLTKTYEAGKSLGEKVTDMISTIGENISVRRFAHYKDEGVRYVGYLHGAGKIGVIIGLKTDATATEVESLGKDLAMQVASMNPMFIDETSVDPAYLESEKDLLIRQVVSEGKPENIAEKMVAGRIKKLLKEICLLDQKFVKNGDLSVAQHISDNAKTIGKDVKVVTMVRYEVGEGIEKKEENFAEEVAKQMGAN